MKRRISVLATVALCLTLVGCAPPISHGTIIDKRYTPEHRVSCMIGKLITTCKRDARWELGIQNEEDSAWRRVTQQDYDRFQIGDYVEWPE